MQLCDAVQLQTRMSYIILSSNYLNFAYRCVRKEWTDEAISQVSHEGIVQQIRCSSLHGKPQTELRHVVIPGVL